MLSVYRASAGSGKTFTLARDYIRLLIGVQDTATGKVHLNYHKCKDALLVHNRHRHILAITFTRKSTEEMKTRIIEELDKISDLHKKSKYREYFLENYAWAEAEQAKVARLAMNELLFDYHNFNVSTIDAFFQKVVHTFARELDKQCDYEVELDTTNALKTAVSDMLDDFNAANPTKDPKAKRLEAWIKDFMEEKLESDKRSNIFNRRSGMMKSLVQSMANIEKESFTKYSEDMRAYLKTDKLQAYKKDIDAYLLSALKAMVTDFNATVPSGIENALNGKKTPCIMCKEFAGLKSSGEGFGLNDVKKLKGWAENDNVVGIVEGDPIILSDTVKDKKAKDDAKSGIFNTGKKPPEADIASLRLAITNFVQVIHGKVVPLIKVKNSLTFLGLLAYVWDYLDRLSEEDNMLLISHTNELVRKIIDSDDTPFIYERMGTRLDHFLIDEFQDTSEMQWENLRPLVGNALASGCDSLVIGDEKQSIYRFRNSNSEILHNQIGLEFDKYIDREEEERRKNTNYRSAEEIVLFNNDIFKRISESLGVDCYENVEQSLPTPEELDGQDEHHGFVKFTQMPKPVKGEADALNERILADMAETILEQHRLRKYPWKEIAVLVNTNDEAKEVVSYLLDKYAGKIEVLSDEALQVSSSRAVRLLVSAMRIIDVIGTMRSEASEKYISEQKTKLMLQQYQYKLNQALISTKDELDAEAMAEMAQRMLHEAIGSGDKAMKEEIKKMLDEKPSSLVTLVEIIIGELLTDNERQEQFVYLAAFQDAVIDFCGSGRGSLHAFCEWWKEHAPKLNITGAESSDAVRVMTIHKSKGLEFECVHIPFCSWSLYGRSSELWVEPPVIPDFKSANVPPVLFLEMCKDFANEYSPYKAVYDAELKASLADTINKTYVAFTRACTELHVWFYQADSSSIGSVLAPMLKNNDLVKAEEIEKDASKITIYTYGEPIAFEPKSKNRKYAKGDDIVAKYSVSIDQRSKAVLSVQDAFDNEGNISDGEVSNVSAPEVSEEAREQGNQLHAIMAAIRKADDADAAIAKLAVRFGLDESAKSDYAEVVKGHMALAAEKGKMWYTGKLRTYAERTIEIPNIDERQRPDRLILYPDGAVDVVDYKFTTDPKQLGCEANIKQVTEYMKLMRDAGYDYKKVRGFLCYPRLNEIIDVKIDWI